MLQIIDLIVSLCVEIDDGDRYLKKRGLHKLSILNVTKLKVATFTLLENTFEPLKLGEINYGY
jgi:hypothetical protein